MKLNFKRKIISVGDSSMISIPSDYITNGQLKVGAKYEFIVDTTPVTNDGPSDSNNSEIKKEVDNLDESERK